jgi:hypothetical protein
MTSDRSFSQTVTELAQMNPIVLDQSKGTAHPRRPDLSIHLIMVISKTPQLGMETVSIYGWFR